MQWKSISCSIFEQLKESYSTNFIYEASFKSDLFLVKLNGNRQVQGILRGFDPFMNLVLDEAMELASTGEHNNIGMVVSIIFFKLLFNH